MAAEKSSEGLFSFSNISTAFITLIFGTLFVAQNPFHEQRPDKNGTHRNSPAEIHDVDARLWQDPLEAIVQHALEDKTEACKNITLSSLGQNGTQLTCGNAENNQGHDLNQFIEDLNNRINANPKSLDAEADLDIVAVILPGGSYSEESEFRRRIRYAVLSGLFVEGKYQSEDADHIKYFLPHEQTEKKEYKVAYEWVVNKTDNENQPKCFSKSNDKPEEKICYRVYSDKSNKPTLVLWLDNRFFSITPHEKLQRLLCEINKNENDKCLGKLNYRHKFNVKILGPYNSEMMQELFNDFKEKSTIDDSDAITYQYLSPAATLPESLIKKPNFIDKNINFKSLTIPDDILAKSLIEELSNRYPFMDKNKTYKNVVVLLSEWDTLYGKELPVIFANTFTNEKSSCGHEKANKNDKVLCYSYLRGLDGEKKREKLGAGQIVSINSAEKNNAVESQRKSMEDADGDSQFDYIRRLSDQLAEKNRDLKKEGKSIQAIGILGSDVYDKLLVLEAMHDKFPEVLFFTTGMDARYLHPDQNKWARNLIVASSYGLALDAEQQEMVPPFRDSLQTGYFLAAKKSIETSDNRLLCNNLILECHYGYLFEIGRTKPFELSREAVEKTFNIKYEFIIIGFLAFILYVILFFYSNKYQFVPIFSFILLLIFFVYFSYDFDKVKEPFSWSDGISIWPTELIRYLAFTLGIFFIFKCRTFPEEFEKNFLTSEKHFNLQQPLNLPSRLSPGFWPFYCPIMTESVDMKGLDLISSWQSWQRSKTWRISIFTIIYVIGIVSVQHIFGEPNVPARGEFASNIDFFILKVLLMPAFVFLLFQTTDNAEMAIQLIKQINLKDRPVSWPDETITNYAEKFAVQKNQLHEWVGIRFVAELTENIEKQLKFTLTVALLMLFARSNYFDNWLMPTDLMVIIGLAFGYVLLCDYRLKRVAEEAVKDASLTMQRRVIAYQTYKKKFVSSRLFLTITYENIAVQLEKLIAMVNNTDLVAFKPFTQRPIFLFIIILALSFVFGDADTWHVIEKMFEKG